jgi:hypothetical protein
VDEACYPVGIAVDSWGGVFVALAENDTIRKFDSSGNLLAELGRPGFGEGEFAMPWDVAADRFGNVLVADTVNHRIQKFRADFGVRDLSGAPESPAASWYSEKGKAYQVFVSPNLFDWILGSGVEPGSESGVNSWTDDGLHGLGPPADALRRFYKVLELR